MARFAQVHRPGRSLSGRGCRRLRTLRAPAGALGLLALALAFAVAGAAPATAQRDTGSALQIATSESAALDLRRAPEAARVDHAALPRILSEADAARYARIFALQREGDMAAADRIIGRLEDGVLMGHVLFQRYMHPTAWRSTYLELKGWMAEYADHPGARRIYRLALKRRPPNYKWPREPQAVALPEMAGEAPDAEDESRARTRRGLPEHLAGKTGWERNEIRRMQRRVRSWVQRGYVTHALEKLDVPKYRRLFDDVSFAQSLGIIARGYFRYHKDTEALTAAARAAGLAGPKAAEAHWWGGLAAWRQGHYETAFRHFEALSGSPMAGSWQQAAGGYWAARAALVGRMPARVNPMLKRAAAQPHSFYGLMAVRALGLEPPFDWSLPALTADEVSTLERIPAARRAIALIEAGQTDRADSELRRFVDALPPALAETLLAFADAAGLADLAYRVGREIRQARGTWLDAALYPLPGWTPARGFTVDRALVFAFVRQESRFRARATSYAGARGLMQLMPTTASWIAGERYRGNKRAELYEPALNLSLGQRYIRMMLERDGVDGNLFFAAAAYNAGPGNLQKWRRKIDYGGDPLLFIESLPSRETRSYVEHVMANLWIYRHRMGQATPSLDSLIGGGWPVYMGLDGASVAEQSIAEQPIADAR